MNNKKHIIVNATASRTSGALTILNQFVENTPNNNLNFIIFVDESYKPVITKPNLEFVFLNKRSFIKRFIWDAWGLKKWLKQRNIIPDSTISLQNTNFRTKKDIPNYIYYHQPMPLYSYKWRFFKSTERVFWFYKNIYPFFVNLFINKQTEVFVQLDWIKKEFVRKYNFNEKKVHVVFPDINTPEPEKIKSIDIDKDKINLFYVATPLKYKNHQLLFDSLSELDNISSQKTVLYLTCNRNDFAHVPNYKNAEIIFLGTISHANVVWLLKNTHALVFPSYIETLGLPLIEAAGLGLPIYAADIAYAREVLKGYQGVHFIDFQKPELWADELNKLSGEFQPRFERFELKNKKSWVDFFKIITQKL
ncbi:glycosyltransferase [Paludibacter sp. 221]|uniref:glycosyltransferase n=1 Tax=Paludibacter sp. 221 TaxID=2302939 RepID=UPI0013D5F165|nr:glycosyltransferase [Paludibacter sp. 221]NDV47267.1 glycosyltransferase [Paludibacter sp. 221]